MIAVFLGDTPTAGGFDLSQSFLAGLMTVVDDQESFRPGNSTYLVQEERRFFKAEKDIDRADDVRNVIGQPGFIALRENGNDIVQRELIRLAFDCLNREPLDIDGINPPVRADQSGESGGIPARTTTVIDHGHILADSKGRHPLIDKGTDEVSYRHGQAHQPESDVWHLFESRHGIFLPSNTEWGKLASATDWRTIGPRHGVTLDVMLI
jgi:hypothetical protein